MTYILSISSQGQVVIPSDVRKVMGITGGDKIRLRLEPKTKVPTVTIEPAKVDWAKRMAGIAKGVYGDDVDKYIQQEKNSWNKGDSK